MATSTHNKYVSIPDWFSSSSSTPITSTEKPANITNVYYGGGGGGGTTGITEIPIDNKTIVWLDLVITVPIDNDKIIINTEGKITTSGTTGVWELRQLTDGTNYIYTTYPVVTQLGITMYAGTDGLDLGSIYDGLPIDNVTIYWDLDENGNKILKAVGSSGGVADSVAWANVIGKPDWLLDGKVLYTEIEGIPDLSGFITKDYIDGKFVTFDLNETIDGIKTFTNGIKIGNSLINQSLNDVIYIDANLAVRGGITMYATDIIDIPSILDSLPVAGTESKGIASFDSSYFSVTNGKVTLLADNVGLNESELAEYLNTNNYAKKSDIPSLNGYATQSWVESKGYALNSDLMSLTTKVDDFLEGSDTDTIINKWLELEAFLSGLSESDNLATILGNKADKSELTKYIPISGYTEVSGEKNFTGGLKVNGSPIVYDSTKKYWKLEGDLLVTGGVTMYGSDSSFVPSTIMDAIAVDGKTISKSGGVLKVIGGTGGGVADSVAWANITGKPTWIGSSKPTYSYSEITGAISTTELQNYLTQNSYLNVIGGDNRYLKLSGGTLASSGNPLSIKRTDDNGPGLVFYSKDTQLGSIGIGTDYAPKFYNANSGLLYTIWHSGNFKPSDYLPLSGGTIKNGSTRNPFIIDTDSSVGAYLVCKAAGVNKAYFGYDSSLGALMQVQEDRVNTILYITNNQAYVSNGATKSKLWNEGNDGSGSGLDADLLDGKHADSFMNFVAVKTYVGASMGNENLSKLASGDGHIEFWDSAGGWFNGKWGKLIAVSGFEGSLSGNASSATKLQTARTIWGQSFDGTGNVSGALSDVTGITFKNDYYGLVIDEFGNFSFKKPYSTTAVDWSFKDSSGNKLMIVNNYGSVGIGTPNPSAKLHIVNNANTSTGLRLDGGWSGYGFLYNAINIYLNGEHYGGIGVNTVSSAYGSTAAAGTYITNAKSGEYMNFYNEGGVFLKANLLVSGGITMYSDQRKKTILNHVELSLKQIAEAPLIEHYYNSDEKKTTHVGSIAQYWASMNDWFCKLDSEGFYTMEIQNAALASAISIARELDRYETKTDKDIKKLKKRICELEEEVERLKAS